MEQYRRTDANLHVPWDDATSSQATSTLEPSTEQLNIDGHARSRLTSPLPSHSELCEDCRAYDLSPLFTTDWSPKDATSGISKYEEQHSVWLGAQNNQSGWTQKSCQLCWFLVECALRASPAFDGRIKKLKAGNIPNLRSFWKDVAYDQFKPPGTGDYSPPASVLCCLRPKFVWVPAQSPSARPTLASHGKIQVWFYRHKIVVKEVPGSSRFLSSRSVMPRDSVVDEPVASWNADMIVLAQPAKAPSRKRFSFRSKSPVAETATWDAERQPIPSSVDLGLLRVWCERCRDSHGHPLSSGLVQQGLTKVIKSGFFRAIDTTTGNVTRLYSQESFIALSYIWGHQSLLNKLANTHSLPATIRDALVLARELGYKWLWVDRVCINQSDEAEKSILLPHMKDIFDSADLTIVAAAGESADTGLFGVNRKVRGDEVSFDFSYADKHLCFFAALPSFNVYLQNSPWRHRGWTFEEYIFSSRLLYVFENEMIFTCPEGMYRESTGSKFFPGTAGATWGDSGAAPPSIAAILYSKFHSNPSSGSRALMSTREYVQAVEEYTARELTFEEDRIMAFAGLITLATGSKDPTQDRPLLNHGHPLHFFETALTWHHDEGWPRRSSKKREKLAPSWSWASAGTKVFFMDDGQDHTKSNWFNFTLVNKHDVFGYPSKNENAVFQELNLPPPYISSEEQPWEHLVPAKSPITAMQRSPNLYLLTIVFQAQLQPHAEGQHRLTPLGSRYGTGVFLLGRWSIQDRTLDFLPSNAHHFAIVAGNTAVYIMLLEPQQEANSYARRGLFKNGLNPLGLYASLSNRSMFAIIRSGMPSWQCIKIV